MGGSITAVSDAGLSSLVKEYFPRRSAEAGRIEPGHDDAVEVACFFRAAKVGIEARRAESHPDG
jgi:hypothetical protein